MDNHPAPVLFVAGMGRCGTTLLMTMLDAGGFPVAGPRPAYEPAQHWNMGLPDADWIKEQSGRAVKWIFGPTSRQKAMRNLLPAAPVIILLERNLREQARSQIKLIGPCATKLGRRAEKAMERSLRRDIPLCRAHMRAAGTVYEMSFEDVLENPFWAARKLERIIAEHFDAPFDTETAMRVVLQRDAACRPDLFIENTILPVMAADMPEVHHD